MAIGLLAALLCPLLASACDGGSKGKPKQVNLSEKLTLDSSFYDFGKVLHGTTPSKSFLLRNIGDTRLVIQAEQNSCSCADIQHRILDAKGTEVKRQIYLPPRREEDGSTLITWIEPGESLQLVVRIISTKRDPIAKRENAETHLLFADKDIGQVVIGYRFLIDPPIAVDPAPGFRAIPISKGTEGIESFELYPPQGKKPFKITRIEGPDELVRLEKDEPGRTDGHRYVIKYGPFPNTTRNWTRTFWFHTDLPGDYKMKVMVGGEIVPDLEFMGPKGQTFGRFDFAEPGQCRLRLRYNGNAGQPDLKTTALRIRDSQAKDVSRYFEAKVEAQGGKRWDIVLYYKGGLESRRFSGNYELWSTVEGFETTSIGVTGFRLEKP